jgi:hypothetical protein
MQLSPLTSLLITLRTTVERVDPQFVNDAFEMVGDAEFLMRQAISRKYALRL